MYVCRYVGMYVCMHAGRYVCMYACRMYFISSRKALETQAAAVFARVAAELSARLGDKPAAEVMAPGPSLETRVILLKAC